MLEQRLEEANNEFTSEYFDVEKKLSTFHDSIIKGGSELGNIGFGNRSSKVVAIMNFDKTSENRFSLLKTFFEVNHKDVYTDVYIINLNKTKSNDLNIGILKNELKIIGPERVLNITNLNINNSKTYNLSEFEYDALVEKKYNGTINSNYTAEAKENVISGFKFLITGKRGK